MAIDSNQYHVFAERLGIDILNRPNKTVVFILDHENESTYLLNKQPITLNAVIDFVHSFTKGTLTRYLRTTSTDYKHTHYFNLVEFKRHHNEIYKLRKTDLDQQVPITNHKLRNTVPKHVFIRELNSRSFSDVVLKSNKVSFGDGVNAKDYVTELFLSFQTVVVLFHSVQCAFCSLLTNNLLSVARILDDLKREISFYRIDGDKNDLQWEYTMETFPSLIIFPAKG
jgi:hypothetical protein